jgi:hypothetical protein
LQHIRTKVAHPARKQSKRLHSEKCYGSEPRWTRAAASRVGFIVLSSPPLTREHLHDHTQSSSIRKKIGWLAMHYATYPMALLLFSFKDVGKKVLTHHVLEESAADAVTLCLLENLAHPLIVSIELGAIIRSTHRPLRVVRDIDVSEDSIEVALIHANFLDVDFGVEWIDRSRMLRRYVRSMPTAENGAKQSHGDCVLRKLMTPHMLSRLRLYMANLGPNALRVFEPESPHAKEAASSLRLRTAGYMLSA